MKAALAGLCFSTLCLCQVASVENQTKNARLEIAILDASTHKPIQCRVHLKNGDGQPVRAGSLPFWRDHFVCPGKVQLDLTAGTYSYEIERGPEYSRTVGWFNFSGGTNKTIKRELRRVANLAEEGWWSGDLHVHRQVNDIELLMQAEDLHVAPVVTWWNNQNQWAKQPVPSRLLIQFDRDRFYHVMGGEDEREGGALLFLNLPQPLIIAGSAREYPSPMKFVEQARQQAGVWVDVEKPFWWDVPIWLASGTVDSIGLANNHMCREQMYENEAWGKPRDAIRLPSPRGNGFWTQEIYYHILNCGFRIPPSAGSASGVLPNPVGYDRVYVHIGKELTYEKWWEGLRSGRSFVSNGPLFRCRVNGEVPGHIFQGIQGRELNLEITAKLDTQDSVSSIEVIHNGRVERVVPYDTWKRTGSLGVLRVKESGWFLVRVITDNQKTFRFASTAPYYVEIGATRRRISKASAQFFLDWVRERDKRVKLDDPTQRQEVLHYHEMAERYWEDLVNRATAE